MTGKLAAIAVVIAAIIAFKGGVWLAPAIVNIGNPVKSSVVSLRERIFDAYGEYIDQSAEIRRLRRDNERLQRQAAVNGALRREVLKLSAAYNRSFVVNPSLRLVKAVSYAQIPAFGRVWLDYSTPGNDRIYGLISPLASGDAATAGIAVDAKAANRQAILNIDPQCSYAVSIGASQAPGIAMGKSGHEMVVRFIPYWLNVAVGDEVTTSGLDQIFYPGIKVGRVKKVTADSAYKEAVIEPYVATTAPSYFYLIEKL